MKKQNNNEVCYAKLVIHGLPEMKTKETRRLLSWLEKTFEEMQCPKIKGKYGKTYTKRLMK